MQSTVRQRLEPFKPSCQTFHKHYPSFLHLTNYDFFQCTRGHLFVAILLRFFRPSFDLLSTPVSLVQHSPSHSGSLDELYVVTPISMYLEAIEGWAIMPPRFQELSARWSLFKQKILFRWHQQVFEDFFIDALLVHTHSTSPMPLCFLKVGGESYALFLRRPDIKVSPWIHIIPTVDRCATPLPSLIQIFLLPLVSHRLAIPIRPRCLRSSCNSERHLPTVFARSRDSNGEHALLWRRVALRLRC